MSDIEKRLIRFQQRIDSRDPLTDEEVRYLLAAVEQLLGEVKAQETFLKRMERSKYRDMFLSGVIGWLIGFVLGFVLRILGVG